MISKLSFSYAVSFAVHEYRNCSELPTHLNDVSCSGTESKLTECSQSGVNISHSSRSEVAAVICSGETV